VALSVTVSAPRAPTMSTSPALARFSQTLIVGLPPTVVVWLPG
jgi:hypothetical protein